MTHSIPRLPKLALSSVTAELQLRHRGRRLSPSFAAAAIALRVASAQTDGSDALPPTVSPAAVTVGEPLTYSVDVPRAPDESVAGPGPDADLAPWEVRGYQEQPGDGKTTLVYQLVAFETGEHTIPALEIRLETPGGKARVVKAAEAKGVVTSVLKEGDEQPADIREPMALREQPLAIVLRVLVAVVAVTVLGLGVWFLWRRTRKRVAEQQKTPDPPDVVALKALHRLKEARLPEQGRIKQHYTGLSDALRNYLAARYAVRTLEETTSAIAAGLQAHDEAAEHAAQFEDLLREADLVKFAKARPEVPACHSALDAAADLVRETAAPRFSPAEEVARDLR